MFSPLLKFYILLAVIKGIAVNMVGNFNGRQFSAKFLSQNHPMLVFPSSLWQQFNLSVRVFPTPNNSSGANWFCSGMVHTTVSLAYTLFVQFGISWFMKTFFALAGIPKRISILSPCGGNGITTDATRFYLGLCPTNRSTHDLIIHQRGVKVNA